MENKEKIPEKNGEVRAGSSVAGNNVGKSRSKSVIGCFYLK
jgi:hypothetical protein